MTTLKFEKHWSEERATKESAIDESRATMATFAIWLNSSAATENVVHSKKRSYIETPLYYLSEWIAENWWVLLFEPQKSEQETDSHFIRRHSISSADNGFPLPALSIIPFGKSVRINCRSRKPKYSSFSYAADLFGDVSLDVVQKTFIDFMSDVDARLVSFSIEDTHFQRAFSELKSIADEEREFCELAGALGLMPAEVTEDIARAIEHVYEVLGSQAARDYCLAATPDRLKALGDSAETLQARIASLPATSLKPLLKTELPKDNLQGPSWRRGMQAAKNFRQTLGIGAADENGATKVFEALEIDASRVENFELSDKLNSSGAVERLHDSAKIAVFSAGLEHRRFAAGRAAYLGWVSDENSRRLMTNALTRDQQASRQFAAEILVPQEFLKKSARDNKIGFDDLREIASQRGAMPDVAYKQATNAGIQIVPI
jgi:hypothetical protein